jgi:diadenosine tetraphosphate (Ap4A) HIT family hydrolase
MYLYEDEDFSISVDFSPLVTGHFLIIPRQHYNSYGAMKNNNGLDQMKKLVQTLLGTKDLLMFEHGAVVPNEGGASIGHAHLHIMPRPTLMNQEFIDNYIITSGFVASQKIEVISTELNDFYDRKQSYIYYEMFCEKYAYPVTEIPHQFLRKMLQPFSNVEYNWKTSFALNESMKKVKETIVLANKNLEKSECIAF